MGMKSNGYSGWTNYETWLFALWLDSSDYDYFQFEDLEDQVQDLGKEFDFWVGDPCDPGLLTDIVRSFKSQINFYEIVLTNRS